MAEMKTKPTGEDVTAFLDSVADARRREEGHELRRVFERLTGAPATMWGPSMVGFGTTSYTNTTGTHDWFAVGFSPRKAALPLYGIHNDYGPPDPLLDELGPHTTGKGCLYLKRLEAVDASVLERLIEQAWRAHRETSSEPE